MQALELSQKKSVKMWYTEKKKNSPTQCEARKCEIGPTAFWNLSSKCHLPYDDAGDGRSQEGIC